MHAGREDDRRAPRRRCSRAAEDEVARLEQRRAGVVGSSARAEHRQRLAGQRREVDLERARRAAARRPRPVALGDAAARRRARARAPRSSCRAPSRTHRAPAAAGSARSASTARSACCSWTNAKTALSTITATIATPSAAIPATHASTRGRPEQQRERMGELRARARAASARPPRRRSSFGPVLRAAAARPRVPTAPPCACAGPAATAGRARSGRRAARPGRAGSPRGCDLARVALSARTGWRDESRPPDLAWRDLKASESRRHELGRQLVALLDSSRVSKIATDPDSWSPPSIM